MTWLQTASGRAFDLLRPDWREVDFDVDVPEALARIARFTGHIRSGIYSVAQHCVIGADAVFRETRNREAAAAFLLHDAHEAYLGDIATPVAEALAAVQGESATTLGVVRGAIISLKTNLDRAIYLAAGMGEQGCPLAHRPIVKLYDLRMLVTERAHLLGTPPKLWHPAIEGSVPLRLNGKITPWLWHHATEEFRDRLRKYLPERFGAAAPPARPRPQPNPARPAARRIPMEA